MAAVIYREGIHAVPMNGVELGAVVLTGTPVVDTFETDIVHIENFTRTGEDDVLNDADWQGDGAGDATGTLPEGSRTLVFDGDEGADWNAEDIIDLRGSTSGGDFVIAEVEQLRYDYVVENVSSAVDVGAQTEVVIDRSLDYDPIGQRISLGGTVYTISDWTEGRGTTVLGINADLDLATRTALLSTNATLYREAQVNVFADEASIADHTNQLTGNISYLNLSQLEEGEHFRIIDIAGSIKPHYLTAGYLIIPDGVELTANTLQA